MEQGKTKNVLDAAIQELTDNGHSFEEAGLNVNNRLLDT